MFDTGLNSADNEVAINRFVLHIMANQPSALDAQNERPGGTHIEEAKESTKTAPTGNSKLRELYTRNKLLTICVIALVVLILLGAIGFVIYWFLIKDRISRSSNGNTTEESQEDGEEADGTDGSADEGGEESGDDGEVPAPEDPDSPFAAVAVTAAVDGSSTATTCPAGFSFIGHITTNKAGTVTYFWETSGGYQTEDRTLNFTSAATKQLTDFFIIGINQSGTGWAKLVVISPNEKSSSNATWTVTCPSPSNFAGQWSLNDGFIEIAQNGSSASGTYTYGLEDPWRDYAFTGTVNGTTLAGSYTRGGSTVDFTLTMLAGGKTLSGNKPGAGSLCGAKDGQYLPAGCGFAGTWNEYVGGVVVGPCNTGGIGYGDDTMSLQFKADYKHNAQISGTYCNGTIVNGSLTLQVGEMWMYGTWVVGSDSGNLAFRIPNVYGSPQFQGYWWGSPTEWCGWRNSSSKPSPCGY